MVMCFVPNCRHYSERRTCKFYKFPKDATVKAQWIALVTTKEKPTVSQSALLCSCHFPNQSRGKLPTINVPNPKACAQTEVAVTTTEPEPAKRDTYHTPDKTQLKKRKSLDKTMQSDPRRLQLRSPLFESSVTPECSSPETTASLSRPLSAPCCSAIESSLEKDLDRLKLASPISLSSGSVQQEAEIYLLRRENEKLLSQIAVRERFTWADIEKDEKLVKMYTGLPNGYIFETMYALFENIEISYYLGWKVGLLSRKDQLLLTLIKLRLNLPHQDLAFRFRCSTATVTNIFLTWTLVLHETLFAQLMRRIPSRQKNKACLPACFSTFTNCRIVLDCTEINCIRPQSMFKQKLTYSSYKHFNSVKALIGVAPNGVVTFVSELYPGSLSDKKIVEDCGILSAMEPGDLILADKGFLIKDLLPDGVDLNIPPFLATPQFTPQQVVQTRTIARARIHVERAIRRIKCYSILQSLPSQLLPHASQIFQVCGALSNWQFALIAEVESSYE